jgi:hypothetical protein
MLSKVLNVKYLLNEAINIARRTKILESTVNAPILPFWLDRPRWKEILSPWTFDELRNDDWAQSLNEFRLRKEHLL